MKQKSVTYKHKQNVTSFFGMHGTNLPKYRSGLDLLVEMTMVTLQVTEFPAFYTTQRFSPIIKVLWDEKPSNLRAVTNTLQKSADSFFTVTS